MLVSVVVITFNHENYISQALDSILCQERDFDLEILVGDDCSADETPSIVQKYKDEYPDIFKIQLREKNIGATKNSYDLFMRAEGKYIAILEGDDYWTDNQKLKKQIGFLEKNEDYAACCCEFIYVDEEGEMYDATKGAKLKENLYCPNNIYTLKDLNQSLLPSHAGTIVLRNIFKKGVSGEIIYKAHDIIGDFTVIMLILTQGNIYKLEDIMHCYRFVERKGSSWSTKVGGNPYHYYEVFMYHTNLESYANKELGMKLRLRTSKERTFYKMMMSKLNKHTVSRDKCIYRMLRMTQYKMPFIRIYLYSFYLYRIPSTIRTMYIHGTEQITSSLYTKWGDFYKETEGKTIFLYGAGGGCVDFSDQYFFDIPVQAVLDSDVEKQNTFRVGYKVCSLDVLNAYSPNEVAVIITTGIWTYANEIAEELYRRGIKNVYSYPLMECARVRYILYKHLVQKYDYLRQ